MATLINLEHSGHLIRVDAELGPREFEDRQLWISPRLRDWADATLPGLGSSWKIDESPAEQFATLVYEFCSGKTLASGLRFKSLRPIVSGVWELKTADLRVMGWFPVMDGFVGVVADTSERIKSHRLYAGYISDVVRFRDQLDLDCPKHIPGDDPRAVVSNFN